MRVFSLILVVSLLGLGACDFQTKEDKFLEKLNQDYDAGVPVETLISRVEEGFYFEPLPENILADDSLEFLFLEELEHKDVQNLKAADDIKKFYNDGCSLFSKEALYLYVAYPKEVNLTFEGVLLEGGICSERNPEKAASFYQQALEENPNYYVALARLGVLYWEGRGVRRDQDRAVGLFKKAAVQLTPIFLIPEEELEGTFLKSKKSKSFLSWEMTRFQILQNFTTGEIGPWEYPSKLDEELEKIKQFVKEGPESIITLARILGSDNGGNSNLAYEIITLVERIYENQEAVSLRKKWERDDSFCKRRLQLDDTADCLGYRDNGLVVLSLEEKTLFNLMSGIFPTVFNMSTATKKEAWGKYFWLFSLKKTGFIVPKKSLTEAALELSRAEVEILEKWRDYSKRIPYEYAPG